MKLITAPTRLTLGLVSLSLSVWMLSLTLGLLPDPQRSQIRGRVKLCEQLAMHCSLLATRQDMRAVETSLRMFVKANPEIQSAAIRRWDGLVLSEVGEHGTCWTLPSGSESTESQMRVPILSGVTTWGHVEVCFQPSRVSLFGNRLSSPLVQLFLFGSSTSYLLYYLYLRKMLKNLDPSKVIPSRVRATLDTFAEGLLVLDNEKRIVLANRAFVEALNVQAAELVGRSASQLPWTNGSEQAAEGLPWERALDLGIPQVGELLTVGEGETKRFFKVNASPILADNGQPRGTLASFDDVTALENNKAELLAMLENLKDSQRKIREQNQELQVLATVDPLTTCLNRRSFFQEFDQQWQSARRYRHPLSCVMVDIDHFKAVNDKHGHAMGDEVLRRVSAALRETIRGCDVVGRYGGEEFCVLFPHLTLEQASQASERLREVVARLEFSMGHVTASFGVSAIEAGATNLQEMLDQADKALYVAKRTGRNQVVRWDQMPAEIAPEELPESRIQKEMAGEIEEEAAVQIPYAAVASLMAALAYRDPDTAAHSTRVADLCVATARDIMSVHEAYVLEVAALLHDIGKIGVPDSILLKPGPLTREEWEVMSLHDRIGCEIVDASFNCTVLTEIVRYHHFAFGGNPRSPAVRRGKEIPLGARILTISDAFDAMVSNRVYRPGRSREEAFSELRRCAGIQFDPELVERFIETVSLGRVRRHVEADSISRQLALQLGVQAERLAQAVDVQDFQTVKALARRLEATAAKNGVDSMREIAGKLHACCDGEPDLTEIVLVTHQIVDLCRSAQRAHIDINPELGAAPAAGRRKVFEQLLGNEDRVVGGQLAMLMQAKE